MGDTEENDGSVAEENERPRLRVNWLAIFLTLIFLVIIGWAFGLLANPPEAELIRCPSVEWVEVIPDSEKGGVVVICPED